MREALIAGGGLGGLSAAIHLRLAGYSVTILESNDRLGGRANLIEANGFRFDTGPSLLNYPWVFEELFRAAGRTFSDYVPLLKVDPSVSFQWTDGTRLSLSSDMDRLLEEFERIEPGVGPGLVRFLADAAIKYRMAFEKLVNRNADSIFDWFGALRVGELAKLRLWRSLNGELGRYFDSPHIREALGSYGMYLGGSPYDLPGFFSILAYGELAYGLWLPKGGVYGLVEGLERLAKELGVVIRTGTRVEEILVKDARVHGVRLANGESILCATVVSNVDVPTTNTTLLNGDAACKKSRAQSKKLKMTPAVLTFYWGIKGKPANLGHHTIFFPSDYRGAFDKLLHATKLDDEPAFYTSVASATDTSLAPVDCSTLFVLVPTPLLSQLGDIDWNAATAKTREYVLSRLRQSGVAISTDDILVERILTPVDWRDRFGLFDGSAFGAAHTLFQLGPFRPRNYSDAIEGLYYTGASTTPGTGMPMVMLSGKLTAERIVSRAR
jgi:phytoene desaturase